MAAVVFSVLFCVPADEGALQAAGTSCSLLSSQRCERTTLPILPFDQAALLLLVGWVVGVAVGVKPGAELQPPAGM